MENQHQPQHQVKSYVKFNGSNYSIFYRTIKDICTAYGWVKYLNSPVDLEQPTQSTSDSDNPELISSNQELFNLEMANHNKMMEELAKVRLVIRANCDDERVSMIQDIDQPFEMMKLFKEAYASTQTSNLLRLNREFMNFKITEGPIIESVNRLKELQRQLKDGGSPKSDADMINAIKPRRMVYI